jgi:hypothetical protein
MESSMNNDFEWILGFAAESRGLGAGALEDGP